MKGTWWKGVSVASFSLFLGSVSCAPAVAVHDVDDESDELAEKVANVVFLQGISLTDVVVYADSGMPCFVYFKEGN